MNLLKTIHLMLIFTWLGLIFAETIIELKGSKKLHALQTSKLHFWIDLCFEIPVVLAVLITGIFLIQKSDFFSTVLLLKIILGLLAILINLYCAILVVIRYTKINYLDSLEHWSRKIRFTWLGVPLGLGAFYLGLAYFHS